LFAKDVKTFRNSLGQAALESFRLANVPIELIFLLSVTFFGAGLLSCLELFDIELEIINAPDLRSKAQFAKNHF
jgi:hypothetical protein